jgi:hypothetical protein
LFKNPADSLTGFLSLPKEPETTLCTSVYIPDGGKDRKGDFMKCLMKVFVPAFVVTMLCGCAGGDEGPQNSIINAQVYYYDGTEYTGTVDGYYWFTNDLMETELNGRPKAGIVTVINGKLSFSLPDTVPDNLLYDATINNPAGKAAYALIKLSTGDMLELHSSNDWVVYYYSNIVETGVTLGGVSGTLDIDRGWNYLKFILPGPASVEKILNLDGFRWELNQ